MPDSNKRLQDISADSSLLNRGDGNYLLVIEPTTESKKSFDMLARSVYHYGHPDNDFSNFENPPKIYFPGDVTIRDEVQTRNGLRMGVLRCGSYRAYSTGSGYLLYQGTIDGSDNKLRGTWGAGGIILYDTNGYESGQDNMSIRLYADTGNGRFKGSLTVDGATTIGGNVTISGTASITGNSSFSGALNVSGRLSAGTIAGLSANNSAALTDANDAKAGGTYVNCSTVANLPYSSGVGELLRIGNTQIFVRYAGSSINNGMGSVWWRYYKDAWTPWRSNDVAESINLADFIVLDTGVTIASSQIHKLGNRIYGVIEASGSITADSTTRTISVGTIKDEYRPAGVRTFASTLNGATSGSIPYPVVGRVYHSGGLRFIVDYADGGKTFGNSNYPWTTYTAFSYDL